MRFGCVADESDGSRLAPLRDASGMAVIWCAEASVEAAQGPFDALGCRSRNSAPSLESYHRDERGRPIMKAYCIVYERRLHDPKMFDEYRKQVMSTIEAYGGKFLVRGGKFTTLEGEMPFERIAMLEFPSRKAAEDWYNS